MENLRPLLSVNSVPVISNLVSKLFLRHHRGDDIENFAAAFTDRQSGWSGVIGKSTSEWKRESSVLYA